VEKMITKQPHKNQILIVNKQDMLIRDFLQLLTDSDISHELRTPLTAIKGFVELLLTSNNLNSAQQRSLLIILKNEARVESVIQKIEKILGTFQKNNRLLKMELNQ
jgi:signal transduction histidine kinase